MRIVSSQLNLASTHQLVAREEERASLRVAVGGTTETRTVERTREGATLDAVGISVAARELRAAAEQLRAQQEERARSEDAPAPPAASSAEACDEVEVEEPPRMRMLRLVIEALTKTQIRASRIAISAEKSETAEAAPSPPVRQGTGAAPQPTWSVDFAYARTYQEVEQTSVSASGVVKTADGKEISFAVQVNMQRAYSESESTSVRAGSAKLRDPLVIQFDGPAAQLSPGTFSFDLDADGALDNLHFFSEGSAALALDRNQNGTVDDGSELFGTRTGNGFAELSQYDADGNGWIDESDPVFDALQLWTRSDDGQSRLRSLREGGVGAISLSAAKSPFQIKDARNQLQGMVRATGVWLSEDGQARPVQQIDLVV